MACIPVVIPAFEPDGRLIKLCGELLERDGTSVVIVDDGSGAAYRPVFDELAREPGMIILRHEVNRGKGRALKTAFSWILTNMPDAPGCVTADADGQHTVTDIRRIAETLAAWPDRLVLGCRDFGGDGIPLKSRLGNRLTCAVMRLFCGVSVSDTQTGLRGIPADFMRSCLSIGGERFEFETNMLIASVGVIKLREVVIETVYDSATDHQTHFHPVRDSFRIYRLIFRALLRRHTGTGK